MLKSEQGTARPEGCVCVCGHQVQETSRRQQLWGRRPGRLVKSAKEELEPGQGRLAGASGEGWG